MTADRTAAEAVASLPERIAFLGFGLIGGSIARALRAAGYAGRIEAWTPNGTGPQAGLRAGLLDGGAATLSEAIDGAGLVVLAGPPLAVLEHLDVLSGPARTALARGATVTDVASTKGRIVDRAAAAGLPFVGGHPMAGREAGGFGASTADLFVGRPWAIVPGPGAAEHELGVVEGLAVAVGARPIRMTAADHDAAVAAISHLPLVAAAGLAESAAHTELSRALAASGWADTTRLAKGDPAMGAGILATNAAEVAGQLRAFRAAIDAWIEALEADGGPDVARLVARLAAARSRLEEPPT
jgi:prephenate dehydrogenase